jgi:dTMP kinase
MQEGKRLPSRIYFFHNLVYTVKNMSDYTGILPRTVVLEGLDGAGTTTQAQLLAERLRERGTDVCLTCEPTSSPVGTLLRQALHGLPPLTPRTLAFLFAADREHHIYNPEDGILHQLERGRTVVSDRYLFSSLAYQSVDTPYSEVALLNSLFPYPRMIIYIDTPAEVCMERLKTRPSRDRFEEITFQKKVSASYERSFEKLPSGCTLHRFDGSLSVETIAQQIYSAFCSTISIASP